MKRLVIGIMVVGVVSHMHAEQSLDRQNEQLRQRPGGVVKRFGDASDEMTPEQMMQDPEIQALLKRADIPVQELDARQESGEQEELDLLARWRKLLVQLMNWLMGQK